MKFIWCFITILWYRFELSIADSVNFSQKIIAAIKSTDQILDHIFVKWQIKEYPNFLKSVSMSHTGWEVLKVTISCSYSYSIKLRSFLSLIAEI
jgi:hypothetical protein